MAKANSRVEQGEETVRRMVKVAHKLFSKEGYEAVPAELIVEQAGVTRGALYHHFDGKQGLFEAVFVYCEEIISRQIMSAARNYENPTDQFLFGSLASLDALMKPNVRQIVIEDGPRVLGWKRWREIDAEHGFALLDRSIRDLIKTEQLVGYEPDALASLISGAINELAMWMSGLPRESRAAGRDTLKVFLERLIQ